MQIKLLTHARSGLGMSTWKIICTIGIGIGRHFIGIGRHFIGMASREEIVKAGSGCGSVGRVVAYDTRDPRFESSHQLY